MFAATLPFPEISPEIFSIEIGGFTFALRWYALAYIAGLVIAWRMVVAMAVRPQLWPGRVSPMEREHPDDLLTWIIVGVVLGGRLGFVLFYQPGYYLSNPGDILKIWQGGMSFHGGFLGVIAAVALFCRRNGLPMVRVGDAIAVATPPGLLLGRLANFINAELWGRPSDLPWAVEFPGMAAQYCPAVEGVCARHPSQLYEAALEGLVLGGVLIWLAWRKGGLKKPGAMIGVFFAGYGTARFIVEFFRQPDAQFVSEGNPLGLALQFAGTGMTMGQLLSLPMIIVGVVVVVAARRRA
ncbi:MAG: prolipoprotein diacylglyceryl transferase [Litoreibacter sp.]|nr:prolipoprotein diacylglyceryl transferase [Litoreibacter sp.]